MASKKAFGDELKAFFDAIKLLLDTFQNFYEKIMIIFGAF